MLFQVVTPQQWGPGADGEIPVPYVGVPENSVRGEGTRRPGRHTPAPAASAHGRKATDKPTIERFFRTLRQQLLEHLPAYKGPDVYSRGKDVEAEAFYYVSWRLTYATPCTPEPTAATRPS